jgi:hypothetical protein
VNDEAVAVEPDHDIAGRFFKETMQDMAFDLIQTNFHPNSAPAVQR